jgi:hypothetical protein
MVSELAKVFDRVAALPDREQRVLASILQGELDDEAAWAQRFDDSPHILEALVKRAKEQYEAGLCTEEL